MRETHPEPLIIGWAELVDIPEWNITRMRAKMDTGARSSALHVENIQELPHDRVRFDVRLHRRKVDRRVTVEAPIKRRGRVKPSSGEPQARIFVSAKVKIGSVERDIELSLVSREKMIFRMLIGRYGPVPSFPRRRQQALRLVQTAAEESEEEAYDGGSGNMKIAILSRSPRAYSTRRLREACARRGTT